MTNDEKTAENEKFDRIIERLNSQLERIVIVEQSVKSCHRRLDDIKKL